MLRTSDGRHRGANRSDKLDSCADIQFKFQTEVRGFQGFTRKDNAKQLGISDPSKAIGEVREQLLEPGVTINEIDQAGLTVCVNPRRVGAGALGLWPHIPPEATQAGGQDECRLMIAVLQVRSCK
jgi:hypothetical protein